MAEGTVEQRALESAAPMESLRFLVETDSWNDASDKESNKKTNDIAVGGKVCSLCNFFFKKKFM